MLKWSYFGLAFLMRTKAQYRENKIRLFFLNCKRKYCNQEGHRSSFVVVDRYGCVHGVSSLRVPL
ncbi:hypothetical protein C2G38_2070699 [Gigaspora rosea]|uniref:Uncharacterized protein n=1 Tax=Gigaspora rosea TaxID=44941 RepID=A0A397VNM0_9GLOM|nr:hypothetical protein C2G38_2070699 [Gigaspora rosea]